MENPPGPLLPLSDCIQRLKRISHHLSGPKDVAQLYAGSLGLFCHLKKEQSLIHRKAHANDACPQAGETPGISAVLSDPRLFASLLRCLTTPPPSTDQPGDSIRHRRGSGPNIVSNHSRSTSHITANVLGRKRALSVSEEVATSNASNKKSTPAISPIFPKSKVAPDSASSLPVQIICASIFYAALQHLDHWPAPLIQAYAEDAFGPRLWVDRPECELLVENLKLAHSPSATACDPSNNEDASKVARYYATMLVNIPPEVEDTWSPSKSSSLDRYQTSIARQNSNVSAEVAFPDDDSDSGEEEVVDMGNVAISTKSSGGTGGDDSSSSGEEEVVMASDSFEPSKKPTHPPYPVTPYKLSVERVRQRFVGENQRLAFTGIASTLKDRLELKSKQNSRLLQALPEFCMIPAVRGLIATSLAKWLQSPALSGAARTLFSSTVHHLEDCEPALPEDLEAVDAILDMQLKANQLNIHIENVTHIAKRLQSAAVARHMFLKLLRKQVNAVEVDLQMTAAVFRAFRKRNANDGLAAAILTLLANPSGEKSISTTRQERNALVRQMCLMIRRLFSLLGSFHFDGCALVESLLSFDIEEKVWSARDEQDKGRIMLDCIMLLVPDTHDEPMLRGKGKKLRQTDAANGGLTNEEVVKLRKSLRMARKLLISWAVTEYAPLWQSEQLKRRKKKQMETIGAGVPDFSSVLNDDLESASLTNDSSCPAVIKSVLFMVEPDSLEMKEFLHPDGFPGQGDNCSIEDVHKLRQCYHHGADLDDEMLTIVLASAFCQDSGINKTTALSLIEHLFECCKTDRKANLLLSDPKVAWEMFKLVEYCPSIEADQSDDLDQFADAEDSPLEETNGSKSGVDKSSLPRLAFPGQWWRVTCLVLIMSGASPSGIGSVLSTQNPTLKTLIKMVTSGRYRFPTVDCDDADRDRIKATESKMRSEESQIAESLFLPPLPKKTTESTMQYPGGARFSARQRERYERIRQSNTEKEAAEALSLATKRKKLLKASQKTIMLFDPKGPARKPPRESVNLLLSVQRFFGLSRIFQTCVEPDLVLETIGGTTRGAIERAYEWLIPVVSSLPSIIDRLPGSSSCFLLLRAYGADGDSNSKLRELSAPLLDHVQKTVTGKFGKDDAIRTTNILLADMADKKPSRRKCARRVLQDSLSELNTMVTDRSLDETGCTWLRSLLLVDHIEDLISSSIEQISIALYQERGRVLYALITALKEHIQLATEKGIPGEWNFPSTLSNLISTRSVVCVEAMNRFSDLYVLSADLIRSEFEIYLSSTESKGKGGTVQFKPCQVEENGPNVIESVKVPLQLLQCSCVLLSILKDRQEQLAFKKAREIADILMLPFDSPESVLSESESLVGLASATTDCGDRAMSVKEWVLLAKSTSDIVARRAALSTPLCFLPRLLLCSGLPKASLLTMLDRLGKLGGQTAGEKMYYYRELVAPSAARDWGLPQIGTRRDLARKLLGRISAYIEMSEEDPKKMSEEISFAFIEWLTKECKPPEKAKRARPLKKAIKAGLSAGTGVKIADAMSLSRKLSSGLLAAPNGDGNALTCGVDMRTFKLVPMVDSEMSESVFSEDDMKKFIQLCHETNNSDKAESWITTSVLNGKKLGFGRCTVAAYLLETTLVSATCNSEWNRFVYRYVPNLSLAEGSPKLWQVLFMRHDADVESNILVATCCQTWRSSTVSSCRNWIFSVCNSESRKKLDPQLLVSFLLLTSDLPNPHSPSFIRDNIPRSFIDKKENVEAVVSIAFECAKEAGQVISLRNDVAPWLWLLLLVAQAGKVQANHMIGMLLKRIEKEKHAGLRLHLGKAILRIYAYFPNNVNLGNSSLRALLVDASSSIDWRSWRTPLDSTLSNNLCGLKAAPNQRLVQNIMDICKSHPLIMMRKLDAMTDILEADALFTPLPRGGSRIRFQAENIEAPATARHAGIGEIKVIVRHWGYSYTEPLWVSFVEILLSIPKEVLLSCGPRMGLQNFLNIFVKLLYVQSELQNHNKVTRLKSRFSELIKVFETKSPEWNSWLSSDLSGLTSLGVMRNVLVKCSLITTDQGIANVRSGEA